MKKILIIFTISLFACTAKQTTFTNPVALRNLPDPTVFRAPDGNFYLYAAETIMKSSDLLQWDSVGQFFTPETYPKWGSENAGIWAPDINFINGKYVLYYTHAEPFCYNTCGIGVAVADRPEGPFTDVGALIKSDSIGVKNSIDQFYIEDNGKKYLIWGSFEGIYCIELTDDGLALKPGAEKQQIVDVGIEASYVLKRGDFYYYFGSVDGCCAGAESTYKVVVGRAENLFGPYFSKDGKPFTHKHYDLVVRGDSIFAGPGHNAEIITDDKGDDYLIYHSYIKSNPEIGRVLCISKLEWDNGFPYIKELSPSSESEKPFFRKN
jgi:arabinan endo-1,5-alpha-L-arabinosidase